MPESPYEAPKEGGSLVNPGTKAFGWAVVVFLVVGSLAFPAFWVWLWFSSIRMAVR